MWHQTFAPPHHPPLLQWPGLTLPPGLTAITGDEGSGKSTLLRRIADAQTSPLRAGSGPQGFWLDLALPGHDASTAPVLWQQLQRSWPEWNHALQHDLADALDLSRHLDKTLSMLSTGSRRKVALVALLASGARVTCLDQPWVALDLASIRVLREFLQDMASCTSRAWVVADYEADPTLPWASHVQLPDPST